MDEKLFYESDVERQNDNLHSNDVTLGVIPEAARRFVWQQRRDRIRSCFIEGFSGIALRAEVRRREQGHVVTDAHVAESGRFAAEFDQEHPEAKPCEAIVMHRASGVVISAVPNRRRVQALARHARMPLIVRTVRTCAPRRGASTSRERPGGRPARKVGASRDGPSSEADEPPVIGLRGFTAASVRMVQHLERRRAKAAIA